MTGATHQNDDPAAKQADDVGNRRDALVKLGRFADYTAPSMLLLLNATSARAHASGSGGGPTRRRRRRRKGWWR